MKKETIVKVIKILRKKYPSRFFRKENPFKVLISTILSQRTRDENTAIASSRLFSKYKTAKQIANAPAKNIEKLIKASGFYREKAKRIKEVSKIILGEYAGKVPKTMAELIRLPGVGVKTGSCVLLYGYGIPCIPTDVHVHVMANRLGIVKTKTPEKTATEIVRIVPGRYWKDVNELFVMHGKETCTTNNPKCWRCVISKYCNYYKTVYKKSAKKKKQKGN